MTSLPKDLPGLREHVRRNRGDAHALHTLGVMLAERGEYQRSFLCHRASSAAAPGNATYLRHSGTAALAAGRTAEAGWYFEKALHLDPADAAALRARGELSLNEPGKPEEALRDCVRAIELDPRDTLNYHAAARCVLYGYASQDRDYAPALARLRRELSPGANVTEVERGIAAVLGERGDYEDAIAILHGILRREPGDETSMRMLAELYSGLHDWRAAQHWFESAMGAGGGPASTIGLILHWSRVGDFEKARHVYRSHLAGREPDSMPRPAAPPWRGEDLRGRTLCLIAGDIYFGDALQYSRFSRIAKERGARVILQGPKRVRRLLRTLEGVDAVIAPHDAGPAIDYRVHAFWMFYALPVPAPEMIGKTSYLAPPRELCARWREQIPRTRGVNAGIVWHGSAYRIGDRFAGRSMPLEELRPLAGIPGVTLYSLQHGAGRAELSRANPPFPAIDLAPDFENTAAAIEALDAVITIDTSVAHLAGALGKRTLLMLPRNACFRWMVGRDDTPWYPSMRLFRQSTPGCWSDVVAAVGRALQA